MFGWECSPVISLDEFLQKREIMPCGMIPEEERLLQIVRDFLNTSRQEKEQVREIYRRLKHGLFQDIEQLYVYCFSGTDYLLDYYLGYTEFAQAKSALESLLKLNLDYNFIDYYNEQFQTAWRSVAGCLLDLQARVSKAESVFREEVWNDCQKAWQQWQEVKGNGNRAKKA